MQKLEDIVCPRCGSKKLIKDGNYNGEQGYRCKECKKKFSHGVYNPKVNIKKNENIEEFDLSRYEDNLRSTKSKIANITARKIAKMDRKNIETELINKVFKGNEELDYGIIKILIYTDNWGIEELLNLIFTNNNVKLTRFNIATIAKTLTKNLKFTWRYIEPWLAEYPEIKIDRDIEPDNFISTSNVYENYQFVISRFFYKLKDIDKSNIIEYIGKEKIEQIIEKKYFEKFKNINFDIFGYIGEESEIEYSLKRIQDKINGKHEEVYNIEFIEMGNKWEFLARKIATEYYGNIEIHKRYDNNSVSDISIKEKNSNIRKIIECKLCAGNQELIETVKKYGKYCDELEIWSLADNKNEKYRNIDVKEIYKIIEKDKYQKWYLDENLNNNLSIKILYYNEILNIIHNEKLKEQVEYLFNKYKSFSPQQNVIDLSVFEEDKYKKDDKEENNNLVEYENLYSKDIKIEDSYICIKNSKIPINYSITNKIKYIIKSKNEKNDKEHWQLKGEIEIISFKKLKISSSAYKEDRRNNFINNSFIEIEVEYKNINNFANYETIFDNFFVIDYNGSKYSRINGWEIDTDLKRFTNIVERHLFYQIEPNEKKLLKLYFLIPDQIDEKEEYFLNNNDCIVQMINNNQIDLDNNIEDKNKNQKKTTNLLVKIKEQQILLIFIFLVIILVLFFIINLL